ncbi:sensor histidine kinase [Pseudodesulfovibrio sp.]|nr:sensor histidine kinase [Pseudodesulfovibrio sp.]
MESIAMNNQESLRFFGKVSASVSHEIKNVFAVINEAAGLLADLSLMAEKGMPMDPGRLKRVADSIQGQVQRGDTIVKNMNKLAHSTDEGIQQVELQPLLELTVALATRMADMKQMRLEMGACDAAASSIEPFSFIRLLHNAISQALDKMASHATLVISVACDKEDATILLSVPSQGINLTADDALVDLAAELDVVVNTNTQNGTLELSLKNSADLS